MTTEQKKILTIFFLWWIIINFFAILVNNRFNLQPDTAYIWINPTEFHQKKTFNPISLHTKWDSLWYLDIAENGYSFKGEEKLSNIVFFPLYPFLIRVFSFFFGNNLSLAGWFLSSIFLLLSLFYFFKLIKDFHPGVDPFLPIFFLLIFPTAFFLNAVYTESLFLFLSLATFYYLFKKEYLKTGIFSFFASLTRVTGVLLFLPLIWEYLKEHKFNIRCVLSKKFLPFLLNPLGTFSFFFYHYLKFGDFFLFFKVESWWGRMFKLNKDHFLFISEPAIVNFLLDLIFVLFGFLVSFFIFRKLRISYGLYNLATILVALSTGTFMSIGRYILVLFPIYIFIASLKNQWIKIIYVFVSILLFGLYTTLFVNNYWAG